MDHLKQVLEQASPFLFGMVQSVKGKLEEMTPGRWFDQLIGAVVAAGLSVAFAAFVAVPKIENQFSTLAASVTEIKGEIKAVNVKLSTVAEKQAGALAEAAVIHGSHEQRILAIEERKR